MNRVLLVGGILAIVAALVWVATAERSDKHAASVTRQKISDVVDADMPKPIVVEEPEVEASPGTRGEVEVSEEPGRESPAARQLAVLVVRVASEEDRTPIEGEHVFVRPRSAGPRYSLAELEGSEGSLGEAPRSSSEGLVTLRLPAGEYSAFIATSAVGPDNRIDFELEGGEEREIEFLLPTRPDLPFHLRVVDADTEAPLQGSNVSLYGLPATMNAQGGPAQAETDTDGRVVFQVPSWTPIGGVVTHTGYGVAHVVVRRGHGTPAEAMAVRLRRGALLRGSVLDQNGLPLEGIEVRVRAESRELSKVTARRGGLPPPLPREEKLATTGLGGRFEILDLPSEVRLQVDLRKGGRVVLQPEQSLRLKSSEERVQDFRLHVGAEIRGVVLGPDGVARKNQRVWLNAGDRPTFWTPHTGARDRTSTDDTGHFVFAGVQPGSWLVGPAPSNDPAPDALLPMPQLVEVPEGLSIVEVVVRTINGLFIRGLCLGPEGEPLAGVALFCSGAGQWTNGSSDEDGSFCLGPLAEGMQTIYANGSDTGYAAPPPSEVAVGANDVVIRLFRGGQLTGMVVDRSGEPVQADLTIARKESTGAWTATVSSSTLLDGSFERGGLISGTYLVFARSPERAGLTSEIVVVANREAETRVVVDRAAYLRLRIPTDTLARSYVVLVDGLEVERAYLGGRFDHTTQGFPPGPVTVELHDADGTIDQQAATGSAGETVELHFK